MALGSTSEPFALSEAESATVVDTAARVCADKGAQLIVGAGTVDTRATIARHEALADVPGVTASLAVVPYYMRPSDSAVVAHFEAVAARSPVPVIAYNIPYRTAMSPTADTLLAIAAIDNVVGMKQSGGGIDETIVRVMAEKPEEFAVLCGDDVFIHPFMAMGAAGAIAACAHIATDRFVGLVQNPSREAAAALVPAILALFAEPNPSVIKAVLHRQGRIATPDVRMPLANASDAATKRALAALDL